MGCGCGKSMKIESGKKEIADVGNEILPSTQCLACALKHACEAWECYNEFGYRRANRPHLIGSLRAVVLHTYKQWPEIASKAREAALQVQEAKEADLDALCSMIDDLYLAENPEVAARLKV